MQTNSHTYRALASVFALCFGLACQSTTKGERTEAPGTEPGDGKAAAPPEKGGTVGASATSPASSGKTRKHGGVCGCKENELCVAATAINDMRCVPDVACDPFDCTCFSKRGFTDPCPRDFSCQSTNWPLVTCVRTQGSEP